MQAASISEEKKNSKDSKRQSQSFDDPSSLQNQNHRRENGSRLIIPLPLASFQPPSHHRQLRQPPTTTPPEKNQSHEEESKVVGHCRCCFAGGSFVASLVRQRRNLLSVPEEASSPELAVNTGEKRGVKMVETSVFGAVLRSTRVEGGKEEERERYGTYKLGN
nr:hypothetical protein Iba_chr07dCG8010 [Ipomoea batatas]GME01333.1 hypothetical protein Iba_contig1524CG0010 [Ipomoea batatas]